MMGKDDVTHSDEFLALRKTRWKNFLFMMHYLMIIIN